MRNDIAFALACLEKELSDRTEVLKNEILTEPQRNGLAEDIRLLSSAIQHIKEIN